MKNVFLLFGCLLCALAGFAQAPQGINYQAIARDAAGNPKTSVNNVAFRIQDAFGTAFYSEVHANPTVNQFGLFNLTIGKGTSPQGVFANIPWASGPKYLVVSVDGNAGPAQEMQSVPYALYAEKTAADPNDMKKGDAAGSDLAGTYPNPTVDGLQGRPVSAAAPQVGQVLQWDGSTWAPKTMASSAPDIAIFEERRPHGQSPSTPNSQWNKRLLSFTVNPSPNNSVTRNGSSIKFNQLGKYLISASAPAYRADRHRLALRRDDGSEIIDIFGTSEVAAYNNTGSNVASRSFLIGILTVTEAGIQYRLDHFIQSNLESQVLGVAANLPSPNNTPQDFETFAQIVIQKIQ